MSEQRLHSQSHDQTRHMQNTTPTSRRHWTIADTYQPAVEPAQYRGENSSTGTGSNRKPPREVLGYSTS